DYERLKKMNTARSKSQSKYVRENLMGNVREHSNGESAFLYFTEKIQENGLYLLDEPENSLSPERQQELLRFLEDSVRFFGCQFVIATHSPFLLSMREAKIYDLDEDVAAVKRWTELKNVRAYYEFFKKHEDAF
ncbi:MAG: AAA family ATPase, partial [Peptococcaceae bacterium]|nr:AAA family ATPase [Peptococcaceae bacterium]